MGAGRRFLLAVLGCWLVSVPVMFFNLERYRSAHKRDYINCPSVPCPEIGETDSESGRGLPDAVDPDESIRVWPKQHETEDRILAQMALSKQHGHEDKLILLHSGFSSENLRIGKSKFIEDQCPVSNCILTRDLADISKADMVITKSGPQRIRDRFPERPAGQIVVWYQLESPLNSVVSGTVNWTATYRRDSTLNAPYYKFVPYNDGSTSGDKKRNYAEGKTKKVAWFVSNCHADNGRLEYARELANYIEVDIYGKCGTKKCPRKEHSRCEQLLNSDYKFYLAFENSHCTDYITEKFFLNGLSNDIVPIVFGARPEDYARVAPPHSYIHTDDFESPRHLADFLHTLDSNDTLYNEYFRWKGSGEFINTKFWCRLCAMLHEAHLSGVRLWYDLKKWWNGPGACLKAPGPKEKWLSWRDASKKREYLDGTYHIQLPGEE